MIVFVAWLNKWQTLISGVLAIGAAALSVWMLHRQIAQTETHERERRASRFAAARAVLPLTLDGVIGYANEMISELGAVLSAMHYVGDGPLPASFVLPRPAADLVPSLKEAIEATTRANVVALLSDAIAEMQVLSARVSGLLDQHRMNNAVGVHLNVEEYIVQAAKLHAMASALLPFARRRDENGPTEIVWRDAVVALEASNIRVDRYSGVYRIIERRLHSEQPLWRPNP